MQIYAQIHLQLSASVGFNRIADWRVGGESTHKSAFFLYTSFVCLFGISYLISRYMWPVRPWQRLAAAPGTNPRELATFFPRYTPFLPPDQLARS